MTYSICLMKQCRQYKKHIFTFEYLDRTDFPDIKHQRKTYKLKITIQTRNVTIKHFNMNIS